MGANRLNFCEYRFEAVDLIVIHKAFGHGDDQPDPVFLTKGNLSNELVLSALQLDFCHRIFAEFLKFLVDQSSCTIQFLFIGTEVDGEKAGIAERAVARFNGIGNAVLLANLQVKDGTHARPPDDVVEQQ